MYRDGSSRRRGDGREMLPSRSRLGLTGLGSSQDLGSSNGDLYYNSRPEGHWSYQPPPPPVITHQPKPSSTQHFQPYERGYPKTLESLAEKVSLARYFKRRNTKIPTRIEIALEWRRINLFFRIRFSVLKKIKENKGFLNFNVKLNQQCSKY